MSKAKAGANLETPDLSQLTAVLEQALGNVLGADEFDVVADEAAGELEVMTDDWTPRVERWPGGVAYLVIDEEPAQADELRDSRRAVMSEAVERALAAADRELGGALAAALRASGDPMSADLAGAMARTGET